MRSILYIKFANLFLRVNLAAKSYVKRVNSKRLLNHTTLADYFLFGDYSRWVTDGCASVEKNPSRSAVCEIADSNTNKHIHHLQNQFHFAQYPMLTFNLGNLSPLRLRVHKSFNCFRVISWLPVCVNKQLNIVSHNVAGGCSLKKSSICHARLIIWCKLFFGSADRNSHLTMTLKRIKNRLSVWLGSIKQNITANLLL